MKALRTRNNLQALKPYQPFIWTRFVEAMYRVYLRSRTDPPQPQSSFGNLFSIAIAIPILKNVDQGQGFVHLVRKGISKIDKDYVKKLGERSQHLSNPTEQYYT